MGIQSILSFLRLRGTYPPCLFLISAANDAVASDHSLSHNEASASPAAQSGRMSGCALLKQDEKRRCIRILPRFEKLLGSLRCPGDQYECFRFLPTRTICQAVSHSRRCGRLEPTWQEWHTVFQETRQKMAELGMDLIEVIVDDE